MMQFWKPKESSWIASSSCLIPKRCIFAGSCPVPLAITPHETKEHVAQYHVDVPGWWTNGCYVYIFFLLRGTFDKLSFVFGVSSLLPRFSESIGISL
jgi:hypothetical protein